MTWIEIEFVCSPVTVGAIHVPVARMVRNHGYESGPVPPALTVS